MQNARRAKAKDEINKRLIELNIEPLKKDSDSLIFDVDGKSRIFSLSQLIDKWLEKHPE